MRRTIPPYKFAFYTLCVTLLVASCGSTDQTAAQQRSSRKRPSAKTNTPAREPNGPLTRTLAASLIEKKLAKVMAPTMISFTISEAMFGTGNATPEKLQGSPKWTALYNCGYITFENGNMVLTEKGRKASANWIPIQSTNGEVNSWQGVVIATWEFVAVDGIFMKSDNEAIVDYRYKQKPNDLGEALNANKEIAAKATFLKYDDGWRVR